MNSDELSIASSTASPILSTAQLDTDFVPSNTDKESSGNPQNAFWVAVSSSFVESSPKLNSRPSNAASGDDTGKIETFRRREAPKRRRPASTKANGKIKQLRYRLKLIESKIQKAARLELGYLNKAAEVQGKRERLKELHGVMSTLR